MTGVSLLSVVLPVYNQADHISAVVAEYEAALERLGFAHELLLVVNNCRDTSLEVCQQLAATYAPVRVLASERGGWGRAVKLGLREARGDLLCYTNSARTSPQDLTLLVLYAAANPLTVVKANRKVRENWRRRLGSLLYNLECRALFDLSYWDINGTPKVFPRAYERLLRLVEDGDLIDVEFNIICRREGYPMLEVPIFSTRRYGGTSTTNYMSALRLYLGAYRIWQALRQRR
jgi:glycosyltransferase involved in cell wall biosynthesis